jgi:molecular chaperone GrpE
VDVILENNEEEVKQDVEDTTVNDETVTSNQELENLKTEYNDLDDRYKRLFAEFENYKKRSQKEKEGIYGMITGDVVAVMLPIMDNLEKASDAKTDDTNYQDGVKLVARQFQEALKGLGLEEIETLGQRFNPEFHEAVSHVEDDTKGEQEIIQEYRKGYKIGNKVVRHSMVIVAN